MPCSRQGAIPACLVVGDAIPACLVAVGVCSRGVPAPGGSAPGDGDSPSRKQTATVADGTHPTGMHSC